MFTIRAAAIEDATEIHTLSAELGYAEAEATQSHERLRQALGSASDAVWVAQSEGEILGWVHTVVAHRLASAPFVEIVGLVVGERARRRGVGRALVQQVREDAQQRAMPVRVRCNAKRTESHTFYRDIGFELQKSQQVFGA